MDHANPTAAAGQGNVALRPTCSLRANAGRIAGDVSILDALSILVIWVCVAVARVAPHVLSESVSEQLVALITLPLVVVVPRQVGTLLTPIIKPLRLKWTKRDDVAAYVLAWLAGVSALVPALTVVVGQLGLDSTVATFAILLLITVDGLCPMLSPRNAPTAHLSSTIDWRAAPWLLIVLLLTAIPLVMVRTNQPYPVQNGWGIFNYNYHLLRFEEWNEIALARGLHTPVLPAIAGVPSLATATSAEGVLWAVPVLQYPAFGVGTFLLAQRLTKSRVLALAVLWIALWILALQIFRHLHAANLRGAILAVSPWITIVLLGRLSHVPLEPKPLALRLTLPAFVIGAIAAIRWLVPDLLQPWLLLGGVAIAFYALSRIPSEARSDAALISFIGGSLAFIHIFEGPIFFAASLGFVLLLAWRPVSRQWRVAIAAVYAVTVVFILIQAVGWLKFDDPSLISRMVLGQGRASAIEIPFPAKLDLLKRGLPYLLMGLLGWSAARTLFYPSLRLLAALLSISLAMFAYFLPESGLHRVIGAIIVPIALAVALEVRWFADFFTRRLANSPRQVASNALIIVALIAMTPTLTYSLRSQVGLDSRLGFPMPKTDGTFTGSLPGEYDAARWIRDNTPEDWAVVSDPTTMFIMQGLTLRPQVAEKRAWVAESEYSVGDQERLSTLDEQVFMAPTDDDVLAGLRAVTGKHDGAMIVFSYRTLDWLLHDDPFRLRQPQQGIPLYTSIVETICRNNRLEPCPSRLFSSDNFREVYHFNGVAILIPVSQLSTFEEQLD